MIIGEREERITIVIMLHLIESQLNELGPFDSP